MQKQDENDWQQLVSQHQYNYAKLPREILQPPQKKNLFSIGKWKKYKVDANLNPQYLHPNKLNPNLDQLNQQIYQLQQILNSHQNIDKKRTAIRILHQISDLQPLPNTSIKLLQKISIDTINPLKGNATKVLNDLIKKNKKLPPKLASQMAQKNCIVSKQQVALKRQNIFRANILDLNLQQTLKNQRVQVKNVTKQHQKSVNDLPDNYGEAQTSWYKMKLIEVAQYLQNVRNKKTPTNGDLKYMLQECLLIYQNKHEIGRCDPTIFEIIKYTITQINSIHEGFFIAITRILQDKIMIFNENTEKHTVKQFMNFISGSLLNKHFFGFPKFPKHIQFHIINSVPDIVYNYVKDGRSVSNQMIKALIKSLSQNRLNTDGYTRSKILSTILMIIRDNSNSSDYLNKNEIDFSIEDNLYPETKCLLYEVKAKYQQRKQNEYDFEFVQKAMEPISDRNAVEYFFGKLNPNKIYESKSYTRGYSWNATNYQAINIFFNKDGFLTKGQLQYLAQRFNIKGTDNDDVMNNYKILVVFRKNSSNGALLPQKVINRLTESFNSPLLELNMQKHIGLILFYAFRNGQIINQQFFTTINKLFKHTRISAINTLYYYIERHGTNDISNINPLIMSLKKNILENDQQLKKAAISALNTIIKRQSKGSIDGLENELAKTPQLIQSFYSAALQKKPFTENACNVISNLLLQKNPPNKQIKINCAMILCQLAQNKAQKIPGLTIKNALNSINDKNKDIRNSLANMIGYLAPQYRDLIFQIKSDIMDKLTEVIFQYDDTALNMSYALASLTHSNNCEAIISPQKMITLARIIEAQGKNLQSRENIASAMGKMIQNGYKAQSKLVQQLLQIVLKIKHQKIKKPLISAIAYGIKSLKYGDMTKKMIMILIKLLDDYEKDVSDSSSFILKQYFIKSAYSIRENQLAFLIKILPNINSSLNASYLLKTICKHNNYIFTQYNSLLQISRQIHKIQNIEAILKITFIFHQVSQHHPIHHEALNNLNQLLHHKDLEVTLNVISTIKNHVQRGEKLDHQTISIMCQLLNGQYKISLKSQQNIAIILKIVSQQLNNQDFLEILDHVMQAFTINDIQISRALIEILANYFKFAYIEDHQLKQAHQDIVQCIESHINNIDLLKQGIFAINQIVAKNYKISEPTLEIIAKSLLQNLPLTTRNYAKNIIKKMTNIINNDYVQQIYNIQTVSNLLLKASSTNLLKRIEQFVKSGKQINYSVFDTFQQILNKKDFTNKVLELMNFIAQNNQQLPNSLIKKVVQQIFLTPPKQINQNALKLLSTVSYKLSAIPEGLVQILQGKIVEGLTSKYAFEIFCIALKRNKILKNKNLIIDIIKRDYIETHLDELPKLVEGLKKKLQKLQPNSFNFVNYEENLSNDLTVLRQQIVKIQKYLNRKVIFDQIASFNVFKNLNKQVQSAVGQYGYFDLSLGNIMKTLFKIGYSLQQKTKINLNNYLDQEQVKPQIKHQIELLLQKVKKKNTSSIILEKAKDDIFLINALLYYKQQLQSQQSNQPNFYNKPQKSQKQRRNIQQEKSLSYLLQQIKNIDINPQIFKLIDQGYFTTRANQIQLAFHAKDIQKINSLPIKQWNQVKIQKWAKQVKRKSLINIDKYNMVNQAFAVIKRAIVLDSNRENKNYQLRNTQLLSVLMMLQSTNGLLSQISTGQGKSTIVSVLAVIKALQGYKVDVITSSLVLAKRDAKEKQKFYEMFNLNVKHNGDDDYNFKDVKNCYKAEVDIIYGDASSFQFDILRHEYSGLNTRGDREFEKTIAIVDEVDSMLIDDSSKIAMLADSMPGMSNLNILLAFIWQELDRIIQRFLSTEDGFIYHKPIQNNKEKKFQQIKLKTDDYLKVVKQQLNQYISDKLIKHLDPTSKNRIGVYAHFKDYVQKQKEKWVESAIQAMYNYKKQHHYLISKDNRGINRITPIDHANTGSIQNNTTWGDGLHQFLQIKEGLQMTPETLITNFLSNNAYFSRYENRIYGLTGTLGSKRAKELLKSVYKVDFVTVPRYKHRNFIEDNSEIKDNHFEWIEAIKQSTLRAVDKNRACLIICETKFQANLIHQELSSVYRKQNKKGRILLYTRDDNGESRSVQNMFDTGYIMIATNLAGRGTDIKATKIVENNGGLHVCVTFLPSNLRVEQQAFGRTARQGNQGSAQLILNREDLSHNYMHLNRIQDIRKQRDLIEIEKLNKFEREELSQIQLKDFMFSKLCNLLKNLKYDFDHDKYKKSIEVMFQSSYTNQEIERIVHEYKLQAIQQKWGLFLKHLNYSNIEQSRKKFLILIEDIKKNYQTGKIIQNPSYFIRMGNAFIELANTYKMRILNSLGQYYYLPIQVKDKIMSKISKHSNSDNQKKQWKLKNFIYQKAKEAYTMAIQIDHHQIAYSAYYKRSLCLIELQQQNYKKRALDDLNKADQLIQGVIMPQQYSIQLYVSQNGKLDLDSQFIKQINNKLTVFNSLSNSIKNSINTIDKSFKYIQIQYQSQKPQPQLQILKTYQLEEIKRILHKIQGKVDLSFYNLKNYSDISTECPAADIIKKCFQQKKVTTVSIHFPKLSRLEAIQALPAYHDFLQKQKQGDQNLVNNNNRMDEKEYKQRSWYDKDVAKEGYQRTKDFLFNNKFTNTIGYAMNGVKNIPANLTQKAKDWYKQHTKVQKIVLDLQINKIPIRDLESLLKDSDLFAANIKQYIELTIQGRICNYKIDDAHEFVQEIISIIQSKIRQIILQQRKSLLNEQDLNGQKKMTNLTIESTLSQIQVSIKLKTLNQHAAKLIIDKCPETQSISYNIFYENLNQQSAVRITNFNGDKMGDAILRFPNLTSNNVQHIISKDSRKEQNVTIDKIKDVQSIFLNFDQPIAQIAQAKNEGIDSFFNLYEQEPIKFKSLCIVGSLAAAQIIAGFLTFAVPNVGIGLISQGFGDLITVYSGSTGNFTWGGYATGKAISLAISITTGVLGQQTKAVGFIETIDQHAIKISKQQLARYMQKKGTKLALQQGMKMTQQKIIQNSLAEFTQNAARKICSKAFSIAQNHAKQQGLAIAIKYMKNQAKKIVEIKLLDCLTHKNIKQSILVDRFYKDRLNQTSCFQHKILEQARKLIRKKHHKFFSGFSSKLDLPFIEGKTQATVKDFIALLIQALDQLQIPTLYDLVSEGVEVELKPMIIDQLERKNILKDGSINGKLVLEQSSTQIMIVDYVFFNDTTQSQGDYEKSPSLNIDAQNLARCKLGLHFDIIKKNIKSVDKVIHQSYQNAQMKIFQALSSLLVDQFIAAIDGDKHKANVDKAILNEIEQPANKMMKNIKGENKFKTRAQIVKSIDQLIKKKSESINIAEKWEENVTEIQEKNDVIMQKSQSYQFDMKANKNKRKMDIYQKVHPKLKSAIDNAKIGKGNIVAMKIVMDWFLQTKKTKIQINLYTDCQLEFTYGYGGQTYGMNQSNKRWSVVNELTGRIQKTSIINVNGDNGLYECLSKFTKQPVSQLKSVVFDVLNEYPEKLISNFEEFLMEMYPHFFD